MPETLAEFKVELPHGHGKKQELKSYTFRQTFQAGDGLDFGCVEVWIVEGGKEPYQMDCELTEGGEIIWACHCPDFVYRHGKDGNHVCKHLSELMRCKNVESVPF